MRFDIHHHIGFAPEVMAQLYSVQHKLDLISKGMNTMATKAQIDKLMADVTALIDAGVAEITAAVAAAQGASPDPAIDELDARVATATQGLKDAAAALQPPPAA